MSHRNSKGKLRLGFPALPLPTPQTTGTPNPGIIPARKTPGAHGSQHSRHSQSQLRSKIIPPDPPIPSISPQTFPVFPFPGVAPAPPNPWNEEPGVDPRIPKISRIIPRTLPRIPRRIPRIIPRIPRISDAALRTRTKPEFPQIPKNLLPHSQVFVRPEEPPARLSNYGINWA